MQYIDKTIVSKAEPKNTRAMWASPSEGDIAKLRIFIDGKWQPVGDMDSAIQKPSVTGTDGQILSMQSGMPAWVNPVAGSTVDNQMSNTSENPVQNKAIKEYVDNHVPALAENLSSWAARDSLSVEDTWNSIVRTTAGDVSIDSSKAAKLARIVAIKNFSATSFIATGFNLLRNADTITIGGSTYYYFLVPLLEFGTFGTATKPNGVLFTNSSKQNMTPTVYFKPYTSGVPTSSSYGNTCSYTDSNGYRFYTTSAVGYMIVGGITLSTTCAHIAWSRRYDDYVAVDDANDGGSIISLTGMGTLKAIGSGPSLVSDQMVIGASSSTITTRVGSTTPTWTTTTDEVGEGAEQTYTHSATISGMKSGGVAEIEGSDIVLITNGTTVSYSDTTNSDPTYSVEYELATATTSTVSIENNIAKLEDWGLEMLVGSTGSAFITTQYARSYPDSVAALLSNIDTNTIPVISQALTYLYNQIEGLKQQLFEAKVSLVLTNVEAENYYTYGVPMVLISTTAGAPSTSSIPDNYDEATMGRWTGVPRNEGQLYIDRASNKVYIATKVTGAVSDWVVLN